MVKCCDYTSGMLRHSVDIERLEKTPDGSGGYSVKWVFKRSSFASIKHKTGREYSKNGKLTPVKTTEIVMRYTSDLIESDRINFDGRLFQIRVIDNVEERNEWLVLTCQEGEAQ